MKIAQGGRQRFSHALHRIVCTAKREWAGAMPEQPVYFPSSVNGLNLGAPVKFDGVQIGQVPHLAVLINQKDFTSAKDGGAHQSSGARPDGQDR